MTTYTLIQHSGYTVSGNHDFKRAVEMDSVSPKRAAVVVKLGGVLFNDYDQARLAEEAANYPPEVQGLIPRAPGTFVDGYYIPPKK